MRAAPGGAAEMPRAFGLRLPAAQVPSVVWTPWQVVTRAHGFHVSRESISGAHTEFARNEVRAVKVFRSQEKAQATADSLNRSAA